LFVCLLTQTKNETNHKPTRNQNKQTKHMQLPSEDQLNKLLNRISDSRTHDENMNTVQKTDMEHALKQFLELKQNDASLQPPVQILLYWVNKVVDTRTYAEFCQTHFGCFVHFDGDGLTPIMRDRSRVPTLFAYRKRFGAWPTPQKIWGPITREARAARAAWEEWESQPSEMGLDLLFAEQVAEESKQETCAICFETCLKFEELSCCKSTSFCNKCMSKVTKCPNCRSTTFRPSTAFRLVKQKNAVDPFQDQIPQQTNVRSGMFHGMLQPVRIIHNGEELVRLMVDPERTTWADVRRMLPEPNHGFQWKFPGNIMEPFTLMESGISHGVNGFIVAVTMVKQPCCVMMVNTLDGSTQQIECHRETPVKRLKQKILQTCNLPSETPIRINNHQHFFDEDKPLHSFGVNPQPETSTPPVLHWKPEEVVLGAAAAAMEAEPWTGQIFVETMSEKIISLDNCTQDSTLDEIKLKIQDKEGIPPKEMRLFDIRGKVMEVGHRRIQDYGITKESKIKLVLNLRGC